MSNARKELLSLLAQVSFKLGHFKLSSGGSSDYYIDCRTTTLHAEGAYLCGRVFLDEIHGRGWNPLAVGGLTMGADPIVCSVAILSGQEAYRSTEEPKIGRTEELEVNNKSNGRNKSNDPTQANSGLERGTQGHSWDSPRHGMIHGFLVRKAEKQHGMAQRIEGFRETGARVVIVDDVCTTGASTVQAIEAAKEFGFDVVGVACLVEREEAHGRSSVEKAAGNVPFMSIFTAQDVREEHLRLKAAGKLREQSPMVMAISVKCDYCDRIAVTIQGGYRCDVHRTEGHE
jgi:orotate phosphoribosyltransferase